ncbi:MAG TPA: AAA family ATPase, partial [Planctomycetota bacterium]|nr:AAA family ATPase [Planctomycetota bacterium]
MKIRAWRVDGFGVFRDYEEGRLSPGLNVFCGPNEAGKTTLLAFLRAMFFGFPPGERAKTYYPPLRGRRHGGALEVEVATGEIITIERHPRRRQSFKLVFDGGRRGNESDLRRLLGGIDERLFRSVFAFSLTELQAFESLSSEAVEEHLYSATLAGESRAARRVIACLDELAERRLPSGGDSRIAELARELESVDERLERETTALERYLVLVAEEDELGRRTTGLDHEAAVERQEISRLGEFLALSPLWNEVADIRERLAH